MLRAVPVRLGTSLRRGRPPVTDEQMRELFSPEQRARWPGSYRPTTGAAALLRKEGVPLQALIEVRREMGEDQNVELQRDLAHDMNLWTRCAFEAEMAAADSARRRLARRVLARDRVPSYAEVVAFARVPSLAARDDMEAECRDLPGVQHASMQEAQRVAAQRERTRARRYPFTPQGVLQQSRVFAVLERCQALSQPVVLPDFPALHNLLHHHFDSCSFLKYVAARTGDELLLSNELVRELALYLRRRLDDIASARGSGADPTAGASVLFLFSNGRLPRAVRDSAIPLGAPVHASNTRRRKVRADGALPVLGEAGTPASYGAVFEYDVMPVPEALRRFSPAIVVAEPHCDRDWTAEMRGHPSVRELVLLGQVDSAAMCSFSYPWLSFGCAPSPDTYLAYNSLFQRVNVSPDAQFMPMDAPYVQQGYEKLYVDSVSRWMVCANDTAGAPHQSRCCVFRRLPESVARTHAVATPSTAPQ
jgi:hypothetical protein